MDSEYDAPFIKWIKIYCKHFLKCAVNTEQSIQVQIRNALAF